MMKIKLLACFVLVLMQIRIVAYAAPALSWEGADKNNASWTKITISALDKNYHILNKAEDIQNFCPRYKNIGKKQRLHVWGELISQLAFYESTWNPSASLDRDGDDYEDRPSGLLQLNYNDAVRSRSCNFALDRQDRSVYNAKLNLQCGIQILSKQISRYGRIVLGSRAYWAVIKQDHKHDKSKMIQKNMKNNLKFCVKK